MDIEKEARNMGWVDEDEFKGDPDKWRPAEEFVDRGKNIMPILKENLDRLTTKIEGLEKSNAADKATFAKYQEFASKAEERAFKKAESEYKKEISNLKRDLKSAAKAEDWDKFDDLEKDIGSLEKPTPPEKIETPAEQPEAPEFVEWKVANSWYGESMEKSIYADSIANFITATKPGITGKAFFDEVDRQVAEKFPEKEKNQRLEGGNLDVTPTGKQNFASLPADAKKEYENFKKIMPDYKKEDYAKEYYA